MWSDFQRRASGGRYLERIKADRHVAKLGAFVLELIRKTTAFATLLICPCARQSSRKSAGSLATQVWSYCQRARQAGGGRYLERIKADRHAAKLGVFVLELIRKMAAFATLLICPCACQSSRKSAGSLVHRPGLIF